jgi:hypothetical protein
MHSLVLSELRVPVAKQTQLRQGRVSRVPLKGSRFDNSVLSQSHAAEDQEPSEHININCQSP